MRQPPRQRTKAHRNTWHASALAGALLALGDIASAATLPACPPDGYTRETLLALRHDRFVIADVDRRQSLARSLLVCLSSPDGELRDRIGYEAYAYWRSAKSLDAGTWTFVEQDLLCVLSGRDDAAGVARPFAALVLAETVHADRDRPFLQKAQRTALLDPAIAYFDAVRDYRGFDEDAGWRHGVAHGADLLGELALEPDFEQPQLDRILGALATQVVAHDDRVYLFGESERIAAAAARVAARGRQPIEAWQAWLAGVTAPAPLASWADAYSSLRGLARRQNTMNFLLALYAELGPSKDAASRALAVPVADAMRPLR
ncbi:MAG TPA: DUF2785 domain-containing protein [Rudaea sp.]|jgi:hypothetical protein